MSSDIDLKGLWKKQPVNQPDIEDLHSRLTHFKKEGLRRLIILNALLIATGAFIIFIWVYYQPQLITTKAGIVLIILAIAIYLFASNHLFTPYHTISDALSNSEYVQALIAIKTKQQFLQSTMLSLYFILLSAGLGLYLYEYTSRMSLSWAAFAYTITFAWIAFNWLYIRPRQIKKQQLKINELIDTFKVINSQLQEDEKDFLNRNDTKSAEQNNR